jgi:hypothetical protein
MNFHLDLLVFLEMATMVATTVIMLEKTSISGPERPPQWPEKWPASFYG